MGNSGVDEVSDVAMDGRAPQSESAECGEPSPAAPRPSFAVLDYVNDIRFKHGIRGEEYGRFHSYCTKRLRILRRQLRTVTLRSHKYVAEELPEVISDARHLEILALRAERSWSQGMDLKSQCETSHAVGPNARHHYVKRFERARKAAAKLEELCQQFAETNSANNAKVYRSLMEGIVHLEHRRFADAYTCLSAYANVMEQRKRLHQDVRGVSEAYASQLAQVNALIKFCSFHMRASGAKPMSRPAVRDEDPNAELLAIVPDAAGHLTVYCRGATVEIGSQFLLQQLLDALNSTEKLAVSDDLLSSLASAEDVDAALGGESGRCVRPESLLPAYEEVMARIMDCTDTIHSEMMSSIYDQEPLRRLESIVVVLKTLLETEKCALLEVMALRALLHFTGPWEGGVALPDCGEAVRYAQLLKQLIATFIGDAKMAPLFLAPQEITKSVNGLLMGMHKLSIDEHNEGMALVNWANARQQSAAVLPRKVQTRLLNRSLLCFHLLQRVGQLCCHRFYGRCVAIFARHKLQVNSSVAASEKPDPVAIFGLEKRLLPCKPILFDLAFIHHEPPDLGQKDSLIGGVRNMFASFWN